MWLQINEEEESCSSLFLHVEQKNSKAYFVIHVPFLTYMSDCQKLFLSL